MAIVYIHKKKETNQVFYVGIGAKETRAYSTHKRTNFWNKIVRKYGYTIEITHKDLCWEDACAIEKYLIAFYGRIDLGTGCLCNLTDGGDGTFGRVCSDKTKEKISIKAKEKLSDKTKHPMYGKKQTKESNEKNRNSQIGQKSHMFGLKGDKHPMFGYRHTEEQKLLQKKRVLGDCNPNAKPVIALYGYKSEIFNTIKEACERLKISSTSIRECCLNSSKSVKGYKFIYKKINNNGSSYKSIA